jgi:hypothetical protein
MDKQEFLSEIKSRGGALLPPASDRAIELAQNSLQHMRAAMLPPFLIDLYRNDCGGIMLGDANIFGADGFSPPGARYELPGIVQVNREISGIPGMRGRTIVGRNALFWFGFDAFGTMYMLETLSLSPLRRYEEPFRALTDCLAVGKI